MKKLLLIAITLMFVSSGLNAKWWIFGKSKDPVNIKYLYINNISSDEAGSKIKVFKKSLQNQMLVLKGKVKSGKGEIGSIRITLNNKETWTDAKFAKDGSFNYSFKPEIGKTYIMFLEAMDTSGKTNNVDETRKEIIVSDEDPLKEVKKALDEMFLAYKTEKIKKFMAYVSNDFLGDSVMLERAVRDDFNALSNIRMRYVINNISAGSKGRIFVSIKYNRMVFVNKTGASSTDSGNTEMVFENKEGKLQLYSMKRPLIFGLSDADNVATGTVIGETEELIITNTGEVSTGGTISNSKTLTGSKTNDGNDLLSYNFSDDATYSESGNAPGDVTKIINGDIAFYTFHIISSTPNNTKIKYFPGKNINTLTSAEVTNLSGYTTTITNPSSTTGNTYGVYSGGEYHAIEIVSFSAPFPPYTVTFKVKSF
jgi:roadblock/LC7 domain-containing protein